MKSIISQYIALHIKRLLIVLVAVISFSLEAEAQGVIRFTGRVVSKQTGEPLIGVNITDIKLRRALAVTDEDGRFSMNTQIGAQLRFSMIGAKPEILKVKNDKFTEVKLNEDDITLGEVVVKTKRITDRIMPEPTDIEVKGNWLYVRTRVRVPKEMFRSNRRLVVQPILNNVTDKQLTLLRPMVYDGKKYNITQDRLYNYDIKNSDNGDPLAKYITVKSRTLRENGRDNDILGYTDSIYVENLKADYSCDVYMAIEDYTHILYRDTTIIARGTVNPLRWLDCSIMGSTLNDEAYYPTPEKQMRNSKGSINLKFLIGKSTLNTDDPQNRAEIEKLRRQIDAIHAATWSDVVTLLRRDSLFSEADKVQGIIDRYADPNVQSRRMRRLPFYNSVLEARYLPQLRQVNYTMNYAIFRQLTIDEIRQLYADDYHKLSRYEFFMLYRNESDPKKRETILRQALEMFPSFMIAANDLAALLIERGEPDPELLEKFAGEKAPVAVNTNHAIALLKDQQYSEADEIMSYVPKTDNTRLLHAVNGAFNGRYEDNYSVIAATSKRNNLLMLLAMKRNSEALKLSRELPDDEALTHYLRAVCLNRAEDAVGAYDELKRAFEMDPSLKNIAHVDGDVNDLLVEKHNKEGLQ